MTALGASNNPVPYARVHIFDIPSESNIYLTTDGTGQILVIDNPTQCLLLLQAQTGLMIERIGFV